MYNVLCLTKRSFVPVGSIIISNKELLEEHGENIKVVNLVNHTEFGSALKTYKGTIGSKEGSRTITSVEVNGLSNLHPEAVSKTVLVTLIGSTAHIDVLEDDDYDWYIPSNVDFQIRDDLSHAQFI